MSPKARIYPVAISVQKTLEPAGFLPWLWQRELVV
jgi:hypothetical protein